MRKLFTAKPGRTTGLFLLLGIVATQWSFTTAVTGENHTANLLTDTSTTPVAGTAVATSKKPTTKRSNRTTTSSKPALAANLERETISFGSPTGGPDTETSTSKINNRKTADKKAVESKAADTKAIDAKSTNTKNIKTIPANKKSVEEVSTNIINTVMVEHAGTVDTKTTNTSSVKKAGAESSKKVDAGSNRKVEAGSTTKTTGTAKTTVTKSANTKTAGTTTKGSGTADVKTAGAKTADAKTIDTKTAGTKKNEAKPADSKTVVAKTAGTKSANTKNTGTTAKTTATAAKPKTAASIGILANKLVAYDMLNLKQAGLSKKVFTMALTGMSKLVSERHIKDHLLAIVDFSQPSNKKRLYVIDLNSFQLLYNTYVAHGMKSGRAMAQSFSNKPASEKSSLGFFITGAAYKGTNGYSLRLTGVEKGINDHAMDRGIVIHGADYVCEGLIESQGFIGRSFGCPAVAQEVSQELIDLLKGGSCLFIYHPSQAYKAKSTFLN